MNAGVADEGLQRTGGKAQRPPVFCAHMNVPGLSLVIGQEVIGWNIEPETDAVWSVRGHGASYSNTIDAFDNDPAGILWADRHAFFSRSG